MGNVKSIEIFSPVSVDHLPCGDYPGVWGGHFVHVTIGGHQYRLETNEGIPTPRADCIVHIHSGEATVTVAESKF